MRNKAWLSLLVGLGLLVPYGLSLNWIVLTPLVIVAANLAFLEWPEGRRGRLLLSSTIRSAGVTLVLFLLAIGYIKAIGVGQLGYGDRLQIAGRLITALGYWRLFSNCLTIGVVVWAAAMIVGSRVGFTHPAGSGGRGR